MIHDARPTLEWSSIAIHKGSHPTYMRDRQHGIQDNLVRSFGLVLVCQFGDYSDGWTRFSYSDGCLTTQDRASTVLIDDSVEYEFYRRRASGSS
jgi:hypothetical protein